MRLINADDLIPMMKYVTTDNEIGVFPILIGFDAIKKVIDDAPTIDAVEVVRCGECRNKYMKDFDMFCPYMVGILKPNMHCSYGEREGE